MKYQIQDREAGNRIAVYEDRDHAEERMRDAYAEDRKDGVYVPDFYEIIEIED